MKRFVWLATAMAIIASVYTFSTLTRPVHAQACDPAQDYLALGQAAFDADDYQTALTAYECLVQLNPARPQAYNRRGLANYYLGNYRAAYNDFTQAIALDPDYPYAYNNRGLVLYYWGQNDAALADFDRAITLGYSVAEQNRSLVAGASASSPALIATVTPQTTITPAGTTTTPQATSPIGASPTQASVVLPQVTSTPTLSAEEYFRLGNEAYRIGDYEAATTFFSLSGQRDSYMYMVIGAYDYALLYLEGDCQPQYCGIIRAYSNFQIGNEAAALAEYNAVLRNSIYDWIGYPYLMDLYQDFEETPAQSTSIEIWLDLFSVVQEAPALEIGQTASVNMSEMVVFQIPFEGEAGQVVDIQALDGSSDVVDALLVVADPDGNFLAFNEDSDLGFDSFIPALELPADGVYTLYVTHAGGGSNGPVEVRLSLAGDQ